MEHAQKVIEIRASPEEVFAFMDDIQNVGWHMEGQRSMPLMGGKLDLERLSTNATGEGATYRWYGKILGMKVDFSEVVSKWVEGREKVWHTIGDPKIIIMSNYEMRLTLSPTDVGTKVIFEIDYDLPNTWYGKIIGNLLASRYAEWCLRRACEDAKNALERGALKETRASVEAKSQILEQSIRSIYPYAN
ncbi:MAG: SRPBCC family protein [Thaumarchaeota archaeon]|nr:SRPBCC family protein [Nitrososphaerota archaeon]